jgi:hypothetical protein
LVARNSVYRRSHFSSAAPGSWAAASAGAGVYLVLKHGLDEVRAQREVPVQRPDPDAGQVGYLLGGRVHA